MLVSRNVFHVISALQLTVSILFFWLIRSLVDLTLASVYCMRYLAVSLEDIYAAKNVDDQGRS